MTERDDRPAGAEPPPVSDTDREAPQERFGPPQPRLAPREQPDLGLDLGPPGAPASTRREDDGAPVRGARAKRKGRRR